MTTSIQHPKGWALRIGGGIALLLALFALSSSVQAQSQSCFLVADNIIQGQGDEEGGRDGLGVLLEGEVSPIGLTNTLRVEAIAYDNTAEVLYAADEVAGVDGLFGSLDTETGAFSAIGAVGCGDGANGTVCFDDIDGLAFDPEGTLYGTVRLRGEGVKDILIQIDPATGAFIPDAFGPGVDYVVLEPAVSVPLDDIDDIAFAPDGTLYGILNEGSAGFKDRLVRINPATGQILSGRTINVDGQMQRDIEGLTFDADGRMLGVQGGEFRNVYVIDPATGDATLLVNITRGTDYEAIDCIVPPPPPPEPCVACGTEDFNPDAPDADKVSELTLTYGGDVAALVEVYNDKDPDENKLLFRGTLQPGEAFTIRASDLGEDQFNNEIGFFIDGVKNAEIHASCSQPLGPGTTEGLFTVIAGKDKQGRSLCPDETPDCVECGTDTPGADSADKVSELTLTYGGDVAALVEVYNDKDPDENKLLFRGTLQPGEAFTIRASDLGEDQFNNEIGFFIDGVKNAEIHASCSQPLGPGTTEGLFTVIAGKDKQGRSLCPDETPDCVECGTDTPGADSADKVSELTLTYGGDVAALVEVYNDKDPDENKLLFRGTLQPGEAFTIRASDLGEDQFNNEIGFFIDGVKNAEIHASCSQPLGPGTTEGLFTVIAGKDKQGRSLCPDEPSSACDCDGGVKQLTMRYDGDTAAWVTVYNDSSADPDKILFDAQVQPGEEFSFMASTLGEDKFNSNISFYIDDQKDAELHTSCSQPIGPGRVVSQFTVVSGIDRNDNPLCPFDPDEASGDDSSSRTESGLPTEFEVAQAYPNPFSRATTIGISLPEAAPVQVVVYDVQGRQVAVLLDGELEAGRHQVDFGAGELAPGVYLYRVVTPLGAQGGKVMLLK